MIPDDRTSGTFPLLLRDVNLPGGERADVRISGTTIEAVEAHRPGPARADDRHEVIDLTGYLLLPAPVEVHAHLDKALTADQVPNPTGDLAGAITSWLRHRPQMSREDITRRARAAIMAYVGHGATVIRTHVDVGEDVGVRVLEAVLSIRADVAPLCTVQVVAFIAQPLTGTAGAGHRALLRQALAAGADAAGACPTFDPDPAAAIDVCLDLAARHAVPVDLHIDEWLHPEPCTLAMLAEAVLATGFPHRVVASHCVSLAMMAPDRVRGIADRVAAAGISVVCLPQTNLYLQGRDHDRASPRGLTALRALREAGVTVAAGGDNLQDPFNILGRADPMEAAALLVAAGHDHPDTAYAAVSTDARRAIGLPPVALVAGAPAELLAIRAGSIREAIAAADPQRLVIHDGRIVARTMLRRTFAPGLSEQMG